MYRYPPVAYLDNASDSDSEDSRFDSCQADQNLYYSFLGIGITSVRSGYSEEVFDSFCL